MTVGRLLVLFAAALAGCMDGSGTTAGGSGGAGGTPTVGGDGGTGGLTMTMTTTTTTTTALTCSMPVSTPEITGDCDLLQQDCPPGKTCVPAGTATVCQSSGGLKGPGKTCNLNNGTKECQAGLFCIGSFDIGICTRPCCKETKEPCGGGDCNLNVNFPNTTVTMCSYAETCTLFADGTCDPGLQCQLVYPMAGQAVCTLPAPVSALEGESCSAINECAASLVCFGGKCRYNCLLSGGVTEPGKGGCPEMQTCSDAYPQVDNDYGVCQP